MEQPVIVSQAKKFAYNSDGREKDIVVPELDTFDVVTSAHVNGRMLMTTDVYVHKKDDKFLLHIPGWSRGFTVVLVW